MAMSGVKIAAEVTDVFNKQKLGVKGPGGLKKDISYISYRISEDGKYIEVESIVTKSGTTFKAGENDLTDSAAVDQLLVGARGEEQNPEGRWMTFRESLTNQDCRYFTYDFHYTSKSGQQNEKLVFITWAPDTANIKKKMLIASSKDNLKKALVGIGTDIQAMDHDDLAFTSVTENVANAK